MKWRAIAVLVAGLACGFGVHLGYFQAYAPHCDSLAADCEMEWLRQELGLSEEQFADIARIHAQRGEEFRALSRKVRELELLLAELEAERVREGYVNFLELRNYMETKRELDEACQKSTSDLIVSVGNLMDLEQRKRYLTIVGNASQLK